MADLRTTQQTANQAKAHAFESYAIERQKRYISEEIALAEKSEKLAWGAWNIACELAEKTHDATVINQAMDLEIKWQVSIDLLMLLEDKAALI